MSGSVGGVFHVGTSDKARLADRAGRGPPLPFTITENGQTSDDQLMPCGWLVGTRPRKRRRPWPLVRPRHKLPGLPHPHFSVRRGRPPGFDAKNQDGRTVGACGVTRRTRSAARTESPSASPALSSTLSRGQATAFVFGATAITASPTALPGRSKQRSPSTVLSQSACYAPCVTSAVRCRLCAL